MGGEGLGGQMEGRVVASVLLLLVVGWARCGGCWSLQQAGRATSLQGSQSTDGLFWVSRGWPHAEPELLFQSG